MLENLINIVFDTNYGEYFSTPIHQNNNFSNSIQQTPASLNASKGATTKIKNNTKKPSKNNFFKNFLDSLFGTNKKAEQAVSKKNGNIKSKSNKKSENNEIINNQELKKQIQYLLNLPDEEYQKQKLNSQIREYIIKLDEEFKKTISTFKSHIAPSYWELRGNNIKISGMLGKTYYTHSYPSYIETLRTRDLFNFQGKRDISFFIYPEDDSSIKMQLKQKATQLKAEINDAVSKGITIDMELQQQYEDVQNIRKKLATREERYFEMGFYQTIYETEKEKLKEISKKREQKIAGYGIKIKPAIQRMDEGFTSTLPLAIDDLGITRSAVTTSLAGSFPFIANDLVSDTGILYGINLHTGGLVIFDRFNSKLPNMNSVVLATSGAGKSFTVKLEIIRYLLNGIDIIVIDPENEYKPLAEALNGTYINVATNSQQFINPFDIPPQIEDVEYGPGDLLRSQIMNLIGLIKLLIGDLSAEEEAILDKALQNTYMLKGFSFDTNNYSGLQPPKMEDLMHVLEGMQGGERISLRLSKYVTGTFGKIFNNYTNVEIDKQITIFSIRDLEEALKTPAMFNILNFIWTKVRTHKRKRLIVCDEAWILLQNDISANFLFGLIKRARKYGVGITTISQDIEDFTRSKYGKPIISNSSLQILLKQSTTSIKALNQLLGLSEAEQQKLIAAGIGEGLMFAGNKHIAVKILASPEEKDIITTNVK